MDEHYKNMQLFCRDGIQPEREQCLLLHLQITMRKYFDTFCGGDWHGCLMVKQVCSENNRAGFVPHAVFAPRLVLCILFLCEGKEHFPVYGRMRSKPSSAEVW